MNSGDASFEYFLNAVQGYFCDRRQKGYEEAKSNPRIHSSGSVPPNRSSIKYLFA